MAQLTTSPISPKMFRHFAIVTVAITAALAIFADGENRQAIAGEVDHRVAAHREAARVQQAQIAKFGKPTLIRRKTARSGDWGVGGYGNSFDASYGSATDRTSEYARTTAVWRGRTGKPGGVPNSYAPNGVSQAQWDAMSEEEREAFKRAMQARHAPAGAQQRDIGGLMAASALRSGSETEGD